MKKLKAILTSSRFIVAMATILVTILSETLGVELTMEKAVALVGIAGTWIVGRTIRKDEDNVPQGPEEGSGQRP